MISESRQAGFSLIEMLIALIVFSVGLLAVAGLQTVSKQSNYEALQRTSAAQVAYGLLEDMRVNGAAANVYITGGTLGGNARGAEPAPNCSGVDECNATEQALHDLWFREQVPDGNLETSGGAGAGGLVLPALCVTGPAGGGAGIYTVSIAWRGTASIANTVNDACGAGSGNYGANNEFRRILRIPTFIDPNI